MKKVVAEKYRDINFSRAKRGAVVKPQPGKTKISIRLDNTVLEYFRDLVNKAGGGNYQTLINDALLEHVHRRSTLDVVRQVMREELAPYGTERRSNPDRRFLGRLVGPRVAPHAAPERAGAGGPLRPPAGDAGSGRGRTGAEPARERGKAATGPAAPRTPNDSPFRANSRLQRTRSRRR
ncbi:MAG: BrnA antitoxin family protein [Candidatus Rokubacteria bacterium]|nr:BrnA antitoxin family protein [Candidatus Rokubacteria bacterium]